MEKPLNEGKHGQLSRSTQTAFEKELEILKRKLSLNDKLRVIWHPDQTGLPVGNRRSIRNLRTTGEGHISYITFRSGTIDNK